jgi:shikimate dehydrogenase
VKLPEQEDVNATMGHVDRGNNEMSDHHIIDQTALPEIPEALYGVVGCPVGHSLSPVLHAWAFANQGIAAAYLRWEIDPQNLDAFMLAVRTLPIQGVSVTLPHKQRVIPFLDHLTSEAREVKAVNTLYWKVGKLWGDNTDCQGIRRPLEKRSIHPGSALILGAGGAALAAVKALRDIDCPSIAVTARSQDKAIKMFPDLKCIPWDERGEWIPDLLVNTTPLGMRGELEHCSAWPDGQGLQGVGWVFDLVYTPLWTKLLQKALEAGCGIISGLEMFVYQALGQFELWTGRGFDPQKARSMLVNYLSQP